MVWMGEPPQVGWVVTQADDAAHVLNDTYHCVHGRSYGTRLSNDDAAMNLALLTAAEMHRAQFGCECLRRLADVHNARARASDG